MKISPVDFIHVNKGFARDSDELNDYLIESKKMKITTTPEGLEEHEMLIRVVIKPKNNEKNKRNC